MTDETQEVYAYIAFGLSGAPADTLGLYLTADYADQPKPLTTWKRRAYWVLSTGGENGYPPVFMNVYYEGNLPDDRTRDAINQQVLPLAGRFLFGD